MADTPGGQQAPMSVREAAARAGVNERTVRRAIAGGRLAATQVGAAYHLRAADVSAWMSSRQRGPDTSARMSGPHHPTADSADMVPADLYREERTRVEELHRQLEQNAALVGMLRGRLEVIEAERDRLLAITAGEAAQDASVSEMKAPPARETAADALGTLRALWRRMRGG